MEISYLENSAHLSGEYLIHQYFNKVIYILFVYFLLKYVEKLTKICLFQENNDLFIFADSEDTLFFFASCFLCRLLQNKATYRDHFSVVSLSNDGLHHNVCLSFHHKILSGLILKKH